MGWVEKTSNSYWSSGGMGSGTWTGTEWEAVDAEGIYSLIVLEVGTWNVGYRPTKIRFTFTGSSISAEVKNTGLTAINTPLTISTSPAELDLSFSAGLDIRSLTLQDTASFTVSKIEFWEAEEEEEEEEEEEDTAAVITATPGELYGTRRRKGMKHHPLKRSRRWV